MTECRFVAALSVRMKSEADESADDVVRGDGRGMMGLVSRHTLARLLVLFDDAVMLNRCTFMHRLYITYG